MKAIDLFCGAEWQTLHFAPIRKSAPIHGVLSSSLVSILSCTLYFSR